MVDVDAVKTLTEVSVEMGLRLAMEDHPHGMPYRATFVYDELNRQKVSEWLRQQGLKFCDDFTWIFSSVDDDVMDDQYDMIYFFRNEKYAVLTKIAWSELIR